MPILTSSPLPPSPADLPVSASTAPLYLCFIASTDPVTKESWCPDVRAALPVLQRVFGPAEAGSVAYIHVGQKPEWRDPANPVRRKDTWNIAAVPLLVRYESVNGEVREVARLVEGEVADEAKVRAFIR